MLENSFLISRSHVRVSFSDFVKLKIYIANDCVVQLYLTLLNYSFGLVFSSGEGYLISWISREELSPLYLVFASFTLIMNVLLSTFIF
jgi:hypothetical protein